MDPIRYVCIERGWKPFYDELLATERKCCDHTYLPRIAKMQTKCANTANGGGSRRGMGAVGATEEHRDHTASRIDQSQEAEGLT